MEARRADIILAGALILEGVFEACSVKELVLSEYALREGVLLDTLERSRGGILHHLQDVSRRGVEHLATSLDEDPGHSAHVAHLALQLFDATAEVHGLGADARDYLEAAALLANVGPVDLALEAPQAQLLRDPELRPAGRASPTTRSS